MSLCRVKINMLVDPKSRLNVWRSSAVRLRPKALRMARKLESLMFLTGEDQAGEHSAMLNKSEQQAGGFKRRLLLAKTPTES